MSNIENLKKQAKQILRWHREGRWTVATDIRNALPEFQGLTDSNVNYPWNPVPGSTNSNTPGSYAYNVNWDQTTQDFILNPYMIQWWEGGAENVITQEQAIALTEAGFGDCLGPAPLGASLGSQPNGLGPYGSGAING